MEIKKNFVSLYLGITIGLLSFLTPPSILVYSIILFIGLLFGLFIIFLQEPNKQKTLIKIFVSAFALRIIICILLAMLSYIKRGHIFFLGADDYGFSLNAGNVIAVWKKNGYFPTPDSLSWTAVSGDPDYAYWLSYLYYFIGEYHFMPLFINCCLGALSVILIYLVAQEVYDYKVAVSSAVFFSFWPSMILWSTQNLKESLTIFFIILSFWSVIRLRQKNSQFAYWVILFVSIFLIFPIRNSIAIFLFLASAISLLTYMLKTNMKYYISFVLIVLIMNWHRLVKFLISYAGFPSHSLLEALNQAHSVRVYSADTAFLIGADISSPLKFMFYLPKFLLYILFSPFPWEISKPTHLLGALEMLIWFFLMMFAFKGLLLTIRYKLKQALVILIFFLIVFISLFGEGNVGTIFRHRALIWPCWFMFISAGLFYHIKKVQPSMKVNENR